MSKVNKLDLAIYVMAIASVVDTAITIMEKFL
jgi:hypothetical protein